MRIRKVIFKMVLTITYQGNNTQDLGYLLYKNPYRPQSFDLPMGKAHIIYPEISDARTTAALILELDPLLLSKGKPGTGESGLFDYVNDRPYAASSFLSSAMSRCFGTAMTGRCDQRPELARSDLDLEIALFSLPVRGDKKLICRLFEPLAYEVSFETFPVDEDFQEWGESQYINLNLRTHKRLSQVLNQIYVLIPVFDLQIHHYVSETDIDNLLKHGEGWLCGHPEKETILRRYFSMAKSYADMALARLADEGQDRTAVSCPDGTSDDRVCRYVFVDDLQVREGREGDCPAYPPQPQPRAAKDTGENTAAREDVHPASLEMLRLQAVRDAVRASGARSVIDIGCGEGRLLALLAGEPRIEKLAGADVSSAALKKAGQRLEHTALSVRQREKITLFQASLLYQDARFSGYDAACVTEVVEHIDPEKLPIFENVLFGKAAPKTVILTTPNRSYNTRYGMGAGELRHTDHRFEWTEEEFRNWCERICGRFGYSVNIKGIGGRNGAEGFPTQMGVFSR